MLENLTAMDLVNTMTTSQVKELFKDSFAHQNVATMSAASKVLAKRGCYEDINEALLAYFEAGHVLDLRSGFTVALGQCLCEFRNSNKPLGHIGKKINKRGTKGETLYDLITLEEDRNELNGGEPVSSSPRMHFLDLQTLAEHEQTEASIKRYLEDLSADEIVHMEYDTLNSIISSLVNIYMHKFYRSEGNERMVATETALKTVRETLKPQIFKIAKDHRMSDEMDKWVYHELVLPLVTKQAPVASAAEQDAATVTA